MEAVDQGDGFETPFCTPGNPPLREGEVVICNDDDDVVGTITRSYPHENKYAIRVLETAAELRTPEGHFIYFAKSDLRRAAPGEDDEVEMKKRRFSRYTDAEIASAVEGQPWRCAGRLKWYQKDRGYGRIKTIKGLGRTVTATEEHVFLHKSQMNGGSEGAHAQELADDVAVTYELVEFAGRFCAKSVQVVGLPPAIEDFDVPEEDRPLCVWLLSSLHVGSHKVIGRYKAASEDRFFQRMGVPVRLSGTARSKVVCGLFGVFDGHSGDVCSEFVSTSIEKALFDCLNTRGIARGSGRDSEYDDIVESAMLAAFRRVEHDYFSRLPHLEGPSATKWAAAGSTACVVFIYGPDEDGRVRLVVANAGDCRAVLGKKDGRAVRLSEDHTPNLPNERRRIEREGAAVVAAGQGIWRVVLPRHVGSGLAGLSVSRGFGDLEYKKPAGVVSAVPDIFIRSVDLQEDSCVVIASDGVFGPVADSEAVRVASTTLQTYPGDGHAKARAAAQQLCELAHQREQTDDKTAIVVSFGEMVTAASAVPPAAQAKHCPPGGRPSWT